MDGIPVEVLQHFRATPVIPLGGRVNQHWKVTVGEEDCVLRRWAGDPEDVAYETTLLTRVAALGWPVATVRDALHSSDGTLWGLFPFLNGTPAEHGDTAKQRERGRLLARFHADLATLTDIPQRVPWRRFEVILSDTTLDDSLRAAEPERPEAIRLFRSALDLSRSALDGWSPSRRPDIILHGDFTPWNLRFSDGRLTGILDFELAHRDHRIAEFALAWRGKYKGVIEGYHEVTPLDEEERALILPCWQAFLIEQAVRALSKGQWDDGWTLQKLKETLPLHRLAALF